MDIRDANGPENTLKLTYPREGESFKKVTRFLVLVPRSLDWSQEDPIKSIIQQYKDSGHFKDCKIEKSPRRSESTRVKWVTDVLLPTIDGSVEHPYGILMDLPTTITSLVMNFRQTRSCRTFLRQEFKQGLKTKSAALLFDWLGS